MKAACIVRGGVRGVVAEVARANLVWRLANFPSESSDELLSVVLEFVVFFAFYNWERLSYQFHF